MFSLVMRPGHLFCRNKTGNTTYLSKITLLNYGKDLARVDTMQAEAIKWFKINLLNVNLSKTEDILPVKWKDMCVGCDGGNC